ncbi:SOS response-associated peptidase [Paenibacillus albus]|uniref:Abasic site processing protein n=1 Tax=Paenibacillus albus TaxID=2495582 RepID=A0A3Q8X7G9_9BACL|nr:SOS response-associated peptidase [Paenibacillus albus]AZN42063.1 SOS response-associated peptidase [Paenibacillus albus]
MCGRYTITITMEELMLRYFISSANVPFHKPKYNVAPGQMIMAIINDGQQNRLGELKWGLVPSWADSPKVGSKMLNARAETAWEKPAFRELIRRKRCIIPADGFYDWQLDKQGGKQPMRIVRSDRKPFGMAGLYDTWVSQEGVKLSTCTILTTTPNELMEPIHDRMPVILHEEDESLWLNRRIQTRAELDKLLVPFPSELMDAYPVAKTVGSVTYDDASCIEPLSS